MPYSEFLKILPMFFLFLAFFLFFLIRFTKHKKTVMKFSINLLLVCFATILLFSFIYFVAFAIDLSNGSLSEETKNQFLYFEGINISDYKNDKHLIFIDLISYSTSVFFHFNSEISITGYGQTFVIIESFLGILLPILMTIQFLKKDAKEDTELEILKILLCNNWKVLFISRKKNSLNFKKIVLYSSSLKFKYLLVKDNDFIEELRKALRIDWDLANPQLIPYFVREINNEVYLDDVDISKDVYKITGVNSLVNYEYYKILLEYLKLFSSSKNYFTYYDELMSLREHTERELHKLNLNLNNDINSLIDKD
ncbi:hypothetical protein [Paenibacillus camelliae]|uniref:hypothetical protein n=1 Tax=Paenibacillus camelliae TaxID=512410 RepID=UPI00203A56FD|nr:hypothetical protein [Paenibacillus camelliae]MCM3632626.1 hypothetical protein [Paenibacillus camelliae]